MPLELTYPQIVAGFGAHNIPGRTESRAFLGWFLENYYRLEETDAQDAICDGHDDKGIDGIYVDPNLERVTVFQTKLFQNPKKTLGDSLLKEFAGSIEQFKTKAGVEHIVATTTNLELRELLKDKTVGDLVERGYDVVGVFVVNVRRDDNANAYLSTRTDIEVYDAELLQSEWIAPGDNAPVRGEILFSLDGHTPIEYKTPDATVFIAPLRATELVSLEGIQSTELFDWNVRKSLGRTKVNRAIAESISDLAEHKNFVLYHNGLTILAEQAELLSDEQLVVNGYTVVNGCQSLTTLYENKAKLSNELRVVTRIIKLSPQSALAAKITRHSNNQNSISARDLQSNSSIQRRLKAEFLRTFRGHFDYEVKRGEPLFGGYVITNEEAARTLLAFDLEQPWACHQSYRLFDELHSEIFGRPEVNALRIVMLDILRNEIAGALAALQNQLVAKYRLTHYFMLFLTRRALAVDEQGQAFIANPAPFIDKVKDISALFSGVLADLVIDLNGELDEREQRGEPFDYKRELKSPVAVRKLATDVIGMYQKGVRRGKSVSFSGEFEAAAKLNSSSPK